MTLEMMYREIILDHYKNPRNFGSLKNPTIAVKDSNPLCGDSIELQLQINDEKIEDVKFHGEGCAISIASASMLTEYIKGKSVKEVSELDNKDIVKMLGIELSPIRLKCALLPLMILRIFTKSKYSSLDVDNNIRSFLKFCF